MTQQLQLSEQVEVARHLLGLTGFSRLYRAEDQWGRWVHPRSCRACRFDPEGALARCSGDNGISPLLLMWMDSCYENRVFQALFRRPHDPDRDYPLQEWYGVATPEALMWFMEVLRDTLQWAETNRCTDKPHLLGHG